MKERKTMKRLLPLLCAVTMAFTGASTWEGAVTTAPRGALPDEGYYAATNSFPRNTVVDITNLETGKVIRVIVSSGLDTPGLLATLSEEAARSIGLQPRSIGRIRMTQPSDPIAFSRFTEGLAGSGDPDYDPEAMLEADAYAAYEDENAGDSEEEPSLILTPAPGQFGLEDPPAPAFDGTGEDYFSIVDVPGEGEALSASGESEGEEDYWYFPEDGEEDSPEKTLYPLWAQGGSAGVPLAPEPETVENPPAPTEPVIAENLPAPAGEPQIAETPPVPPAGELPPRVSTQTEGAGSWASAWVTAPRNPVEPPPGAYDYSLVPAEERPPADSGLYLILPEAEIGPVAQATPSPPPPRPDPVIDRSLFIESIEDMRERNAVPPPPPVTPEGLAGPAEPERALPEPVLIEPFPLEPAIPEPVIVVEDPALPETGSPAAPEPKVTAAPVKGESGKRDFSIPVIGELEKGKYYLQLGAYSKPDILESSVSKLDSRYPLSVQTAGSTDKPLYRLLLGPVNLGESGALLQRFKGSGYGDAFVRTY
jgi:hypothetical protein